MTRPRARRAPSPEGDERDRDATEHRVLWDEDLLAYAPSGWKTGGRQTVHVSRRPRVSEVIEVTLEEPSEEPAAEPSVEPVRERATSAALVHVPVRPPDPRLAMLVDQDSERAASFRLLCDNLLERGLPRVVAVSSAAPHEGKTTCALNLALGLAERTTTTVLLIDGNYMAPALAEIFGIDEHTPPSPPVSLPWLAPFRIAELSPCLHVAALVRPSGSRVPFELHRFDTLIERLSRVGYERIIIDAPALDGTAAVSRLVGVADGVLFAVRSGRTTTRALRRAVERIPKGKALGVALMDAKP